MNFPKFVALAIRVLLMPLAVATLVISVAVAIAGEGFGLFAISTPAVIVMMVGSALALIHIFLTARYAMGYAHEVQAEFNDNGAKMDSMSNHQPDTGDLSHLMPRVGSEQWKRMNEELNG